MIEIKDLTKSFDGVEVLSHISMTLEKGKIYTIRINEENPKKLCYLRKNFQMEDLLTFILGMAFWLSGIFYLIGEFVFFK